MTLKGSFVPDTLKIFLTSRDHVYYNKQSLNLPVGISPD